MKNIISSLLRKVLSVLFKVTVNGKLPENNDKGLLFISNHESFIDGLLLGLFLNKYSPVFIVHTTVSHNIFFRLILSLTEYYAVDPTSPLSMKNIIKLINSGRNVVIFPEGRITTTGSLMKIYDGTAFVAYKTQADIVPVRLHGPQFSYFSRMNSPHPKKLFPKITITFMPTVKISEPDAGTASLKRQIAGSKLKTIMESMIFNSTEVLPLYDSFYLSAKTYGWKTKIAEDIRQKEFSYSYINKEILAISSLITRITKGGDFVSLILPNLITTFSIFMALNSTRRVPCFINYTSGYDGIKSALQTADSNLVITSRRFLEVAKITDFFEQIVKELDIKVVYLEELKSNINFKDKVYTLLNHYIYNTQLSNVNIHDTSVVIFTSGSEGKPKGVALSHKAILSNVSQIKSIISFNTEDKVFNALPMFHSFGLTAGSILPILCGTKIFLYPSPLHYKVIPEIVYDRRCSILFGTNSFLQKYAQYANPHDFYCLKYVIAGAEKLSSKTYDLWVEKFGIRVLEGYGTTETAPVISVNTPTSFKKGSVGKPLPGIECYISPQQGIDIGGKLLVSAPNLMSGYILHDKPRVIQPVTSEMGSLWYDTGDIVEIDSEGFLHIKGRAKRFAKVAGEMVSLENTEKIAHTYCPEFMHASIAIADSQKGEAIVLFTDNKELTRNSLIPTCRNLGLTELSLPSKVVYLREIPLLGTGKTDYNKLKTLEF